MLSRVKARRQARTLSERGQRTQHVCGLPTRENKRGPVMVTGGADAAGAPNVLDEHDMRSNSSSNAASQKSIKTYVDGKISTQAIAVSDNTTNLVNLTTTVENII